MDLTARVDVNFARADVNLQTVTFFSFLKVNTKIPLILHTKFYLKILNLFD